MKRFLAPPGMGKLLCAICMMALITLGFASMAAAGSSNTSDTGQYIASGGTQTNTSVMPAIAFDPKVNPFYKQQPANAPKTNPGDQANTKFDPKCIAKASAVQPPTVGASHPVANPVRIAPKTDMASSEVLGVGTSPAVTTMAQGIPGANPVQPGIQSSRYSGSAPSINTANVKCAGAPNQNVTWGA